MPNLPTSIVGFCKDLLEVADVLQKAVEAAKVEDEKLGSSLAGGIELTQTQMHQVFSRHGLSQISPCVGETKFDPNMHEALFQVPVPDKGKFFLTVIINLIGRLKVRIPQIYLQPNQYA